MRPEMATEFGRGKVLEVQIAVAAAIVEGLVQRGSLDRDVVSGAAQRIAEKLRPKAPDIAARIDGFATYLNHAAAPR